MKIEIFNNNFLYLEKIDDDDDELDIKNKKLKDFYINKNSINLDNIYGHNTEYFYNIVLLPRLLVTEKYYHTNFYFNLCKIALSVDSDYIDIVYNEIKNYELLCNLAVEDYHENIFNIPLKKVTYYLVKILFQKDKYFILENKYSDYRVTFFREKFLTQLKEDFPEDFK
jgi:hypothetical protein